jgi:hypothetical protein
MRRITMPSRVSLPAAFAVAMLLSSAIHAADAEPPRRAGVAGEKLDSGLGRLSGARVWVGAVPATGVVAAEKAPERKEYRVPGEKLDNGLGELAMQRRVSYTVSGPSDGSVRPAR